MIKMIFNQKFFKNDKLTKTNGKNIHEQDMTNVVNIK